MSSSNSTEDETCGLLNRGEVNVFPIILDLAQRIGAVSLTLINAFIAIAFLVQKIRRPVRVSPSGLLVLNLVFADGMFGLFLMIIANNLVDFSDLCGILMGYSFFATLGAQFALINVLVDRFIAIVYTLQYRGWMSMRRIIAMVLCGWFVPVAGLVYGIASNDQNLGPVARCIDIPSIGKFQKYAFVPVHASSALCVIVIQCCVCLHLHRHDAVKATSSLVRGSSHKSDRILFWIVTPTFVAFLCRDVAVVFFTQGFGCLLGFIYNVLVVFVELAFLSNVMVYSYATANIKNPVGDLLKDIKVCCCSSKRVTPRAQQKQVVLSNESDSANKPSSSSGDTSLTDV